MNYYDEEITISGPGAQQLSQIKVERLPSGRSGKLAGTWNSGSALLSASSRGSRNSRGTLGRTGAKQQHGTDSSMDDDGLLQDMIDHDDEADTDDDLDDSDVPHTSSYTPKNKTQAVQQLRTTGTQRPQTQQQRSSAQQQPQQKKQSLEHDSEQSDTESDEPTALRHNITDALTEFTSASNESKFNVTPDKWESLNVHQEIKDIFPYILKYTPQTINVPYRLQAFIPEYVPAVGDVDAFIKVTAPQLLQPTRQREIDQHIAKLGLNVLDEPMGEQSEPSLLTMKLRSVLTGSGVNPRSASAALIPTVKSPKDIDKWINEVEQVHIAQATYDAPLRSDIDALLLDWPRSYANCDGALQDAYQRCLKQELGLDAYVRELSERFGVTGPLDTQADYLLNVHTLFALYLVANQAWE